MITTDTGKSTLIRAVLCQSVRRQASIREPQAQASVSASSQSCRIHCEKRCAFEFGRLSVGGVWEAKKALMNAFCGLPSWSVAEAYGLRN